MNKNILNILLIIFISIFMCSCQTAKDALQGKKRSEQKDEFLVQKKNPLAMPPDYEMLPLPGKEEIFQQEDSNESEIKDLLSIGEDQNEEKKTDKSEDLEKTILENLQ